MKEIPFHSLNCDCFHPTFFSVKVFHMVIFLIIFYTTEFLVSFEDSRFSREILPAILRLEDDSKNFWICEYSAFFNGYSEEVSLHVHVRTPLFRIHTKDKFKLFLFSPTYFFHIWFFVAISRNFKGLRCRLQLCILTMFLLQTVIYDIS